MTEYWKSIGKKYCEICKNWMTNNKISIETHERSAKHRANVERRLREVRRSGTVREKEQERYNLEMMKIEAAALGAFEKDISANPKLAKEYKSSNSILDKLPVVNASTPSTSTMGRGRFGDEGGGSSAESATLVRGRERALDTIAKKMEKRSKWLEANTAEGSTYYWNRETYETIWDKPKEGFLTLEEQKTMNVTSVAPAASTEPAQGGVYRHNPYGKWTTVKETTYEENMPDLKLPSVPGEFVEVEVPVTEEPVRPKVEFQEKTVESLGKTGMAQVKMEFKKRKVNENAKRNVRQKLTDDE